MSMSIKRVIAGLLIAPAMMFGVVSLAPSTAMAATCDGDTIQAGVDCANQGRSTTTLDAIFKNIIDAALFVIGAISVLMLIYGGIRYTLSAGNATSVTAAKNTILYAIVGIVVAFLAYAIVHWVLGAITGATS